MRLSVSAAALIGERARTGAGNSGLASLSFDPQRLHLNRPMRPSPAPGNVAGRTGPSNRSVIIPRSGCGWVAPLPSEAPNSSAPTQSGVHHHIPRALRLSRYGPGPALLIGLALMLVVTAAVFLKGGRRHRPYHPGRASICFDPQRI